jgi:hypothetical protein
LNPAAHDQSPDLDLRFDLGRLADDEQFLADDLTFEVTVDANRTGKAQDPLELRPLSEEGANLAEVGAHPLLVSLQHQNLPGRETASRVSGNEKRDPK